jgi:hypothetical protein
MELRFVSEHYPVGEEEKGQTDRRAFRKGPRNHLQVSVADVCNASITHMLLPNKSADSLQGTNNVTV